VKIDWGTVPLWPMYLALYVVAGFVVAQSVDVTIRRQCAASSPLTREGRLLAGAAWPVTAATMMLLGQDPLAVLTARADEPPNT
jgi:hypothetical protein